MNTSLGLLEVVGLALAIKAADTMAKAANIAITGIERAKGSGWMLITITGDVAAVASALANGAELARRENGWVADRTIARPADALATWFSLNSPAVTQTEPRKATDAEPAANATAGDAIDTAIAAAPTAGDAINTATDAEPTANATAGDAIDTAAAAEPAAKPSDSAAICNLCHDPACPRRKGEPRASCIHDGERGSV